MNECIVNNKKDNNFKILKMTHNLETVHVCALYHIFRTFLFWAVLCGAFLCTPLIIKRDKHDFFIEID